jgi:hypothetical protein
VISFRYHLVSLIGVFLALALGVVIGTSALNGAVVGDLRRQNSDLKRAASDSDARNQALQARGAAADQLAQTFGAKIAAGTLAKKAVVLVGAPGASKAMKDAISAQINAAGGKVVGQLQLSSDFTDPAHGNEIQTLATSGVHPIGLQLPSTDSQGLLAGALLGYVLLGHGSATDLTQVVTAFSSSNLVKVESSSMAAGNAVVLVAPGGMAKNDDHGPVLVSFASELATLGGPTVVAGDRNSATANGLVQLVRADGTAQKSVSTVDNADTGLGQLTVALTLADAIAGHKGSYGDAGADALMPGASG